MKRKIFFLTMACAVLVIGLSMMSVPASATPTNVYTMDWYTIDGGGAMDLSGGTYTLSGTIAQYDAGAHSGGNYRLAGGFWGFLDQVLSNSSSSFNLYLPFVKK